MAAGTLRPTVGAALERPTRPAPAARLHFACTARDTRTRRESRGDFTDWKPGSRCLPLPTAAWWVRLAAAGAGPATAWQIRLDGSGASGRAPPGLPRAERGFPVRGSRHFDRARSIAA